MDEQGNSEPEEFDRGGEERPPGYPPRHDGGNGHDGHDGPDHRPYAFRPGEVLIVEADLPLLGGPGPVAQRSGLRRASSGERNERDATLEALGIQRWLTTTEDADVPAIVEDLRTPVAGESKGVDETPEIVPRVFPDHGFYAHWHDWYPHGRYLQRGPALAKLPRRRLPPLPGWGVTVGVLDTGIRPGGVEWFDGRVRSRFPDDEDRPFEDDGLPNELFCHGTHVAGIVLQYAPGVRIILRRVQGLGQRLVHDSDVAGGILELGRAGADIIVCCFGGPTHDNLPAPATDAAINELRRTHPGLVVVASAGNSGVFFPFSPAALDTVVAVGALTAGADVRTHYSNYGAWVDAAAPGEDVPSVFRLEHPFHGWAIWSGTSMATPKVAAAIATERSPGGWRQFMWFLRPSTARQAAYRLLNDPGAAWNPEVGTVIRQNPYVA
jgi:hypothetical protein